MAARPVRNLLTAALALASFFYCYLLGIHPAILCGLARRALDGLWLWLAPGAIKLHRRKDALEPTLLSRRSNVGPRGVIDSDKAVAGVKSRECHPRGAANANGRVQDAAVRESLS